MNYPALLTAISAAHTQAQAGAAGAVNRHLILRSWLIGAHLVEFEQNGEGRAKYGAGLLKRVASDLRTKNIPGCAVRMLERMRVFYSNDELDALAKHCSEQETAAKKVERQVVKSAAAMLLTARIGEKFEATVTGVTDRGVWVRLFQPPIEGKLQQGGEGRQVGDRLRVQLIHADVERGHIDFIAVR